MRVYETHPGDGQYDCLSICADDQSTPHGKHLCDFNVQSQHFHVFSELQPTHNTFNTLRWPGWPDVKNNYVLAFLSAEDPAKTVQEIEGLVGLPPAKGQTPATVPYVLSVRVMAHLLQTFMLERRKLSVECAFCDSSGQGGSGVRRWPSTVTDHGSQIYAPTDGSSYRELTRLWRIGFDGAEEFVALDMPSCTVYFDDKAMFLWTQYQKNGRKPRPIADYVASLLI